MTDSQKERRMWRLSIASIIVLAVVLFMLFIYGLYKINVIELPGPLAALFGGGEDELTEIIPGDDGEIMRIIREGEQDDRYFVLPSDEVDLAGILYDTPETPIYTMTNRTTLTSGDSVLSQVNRIWRSGSRYRVETYDSSGAKLLSTVVCDGDRVSISDPLYGTTAYYDATPEFTVSSQAGMPDISLTRGEDAPELTVSMVRTQDDNLYYVVYDYPDLGQREELYISVEYGIVMRAESYVGEDIVYTVEVESFAIADSIPNLRFQINE